MSLGHTLSLTFFCKKKKNSSSAVFLLIRVRRLHTISIGFIDDNEEFLYDSFYMYILDIYSAILLAIVSNFVSIFRYIRMSFIH